MSKWVRKGGLAAALAVALGGVASAADVYVPPPTVAAVTPIMAPTPFLWAGHYVGLQGGLIWQDGTNGIAGVFGGWNWQDGPWVYGVDLNANYAFTDGFIGNIRGRLGYALADRWLLYGTAGFAGASFGSGFTIGAGLEYAAWDHANLRFDYAYTDNADASTFMVGVVFKNNWLGY